MSYKTVLVHVDNKKHTGERIDFAAKVAINEEAHLIGAAPTGISRFIYQTGYVYEGGGVAMHLESISANCASRPAMRWPCSGTPRKNPVCGHRRHPAAQTYQQRQRGGVQSRLAQRCTRRAARCGHRALPCAPWHQGQRGVPENRHRRWQRFVVERHRPRLRHADDGRLRPLALSRNPARRCHPHHPGIDDRSGIDGALIDQQGLGETRKAGCAISTFTAEQAASEPIRISLIRHCWVFYAPSPLVIKSSNLRRGIFICRPVYH